MILIFPPSSGSYLPRLTSILKSWDLDGWLCPVSFFTKKVLASSPTAHFATLRQPFPIRQVQSVLAILLKQELFGKLSADLGNTNKFATSVPFCFTLTGTFERNYPFFCPPFLSEYNGSQVTHFFQAMIRPWEWLDEVRCSIHLHYHIVSLLFFLILLLSRTGSYCLIKLLRQTVAH